MRHLFVHWSRISARLRSASVIALFLDFDGTMARLEHRPHEVLLEGPVRHVLAALARSPRFRIWVISGRRQADVRARTRVPGIRYLGLHGWEGRGSALAGETQRDLPVLLARLEGCLGNIRGMWIEDKQYAVAIHYRGAAASDILLCRLRLNQIVEPFTQRFRIAHGKKVWEILPRALEDKGVAARQQLARLGDHALPVYVGDDQVDEPAFAALRQGITVRVGSFSRSHARYRLGGVPDVRRFLQKLLEL